MTAPPSVVSEVEAFLARHGADPQTVQASGVANAVDDATTEEIDAALAELSARENGTAEVTDS